jgi:hypothetical protein
MRGVRNRAKRPSAGGRRGKERAARLRAEQRLAAGGPQGSPDPDKSATTKLVGSPDPDYVLEGLNTLRGLTRQYLLRRLGMYVLTVWLGATLIFAIPRMVPGDPVAAMISRMSQSAGRIENSAAMIEAWRVRFGLDAPMPIQ